MRRKDCSPFCWFLLTLVWGRELISFFVSRLVSSEQLSFVRHRLWIPAASTTPLKIHTEYLLSVVVNELKEKV